MRTYPRLSDFALAPSRGIEDSSRKSEHARQVLDESLLGSDACPVPRPAPILSQPLPRASSGPSGEVAWGTGAGRSRPRRPTASSTEPLSFPEQGSRWRLSHR